MQFNTDKYIYTNGIILNLNLFVQYFFRNFDTSSIIRNDTFSNMTKGTYFLFKNIRRMLKWLFIIYKELE